jgi:hypothetical protein
MLCIDDLITFRLTSKQMARSAKKCEKNQAVQKEKLKQVGSVPDKVDSFVSVLHKCSWSLCVTCSRLSSSGIWRGPRSMLRT